MSFRIAAVFLIVVTLPSLSGAQSKNLTMSGVVTDQQSRRPVAGATVTIVGNKAKSDATTDTEGSFIVTLAQGVAEGTSVRIRVEKPGYTAYDKWTPVSSSVVLQISLVPTRTARVAATPIVRTDSFSTLVPLINTPKNAPIPLDENLSDPHLDFYGDLVELADRPDVAPAGERPYTERKLGTVSDSFAFVTRLIQFEVFRSIYFLQRPGPILKTTMGAGVTVIDKKTVVPPQAEPYSMEVLSRTLSGNEFVKPWDQILWQSKDKPLTFPIATNLTFIEQPAPETGGPMSCIVRLGRPNHFMIEFVVTTSLGAGGPPAVFVTSAQNITTYAPTVTMNYEIQRSKDHDFQPDQYAAWADSLFDGLKKRMGFDAGSQVPKPASPGGDPTLSSDLRFLFFGRDALFFSFRNPSGQTAFKPKYWFGILDLNNPYSYPGKPDVAQPFPIPAQVLGDDFVRPGETQGNIEVLNQVAKGHAQVGDRLYGIAGLTCANCVKTRLYYLYWRVGEAGWYSEITDTKSAELPVIKPLRPATDAEIDEYIDRMVPPVSRIPIPEKGPQ